MFLKYGNLSQSLQNLYFKKNFFLKNANFLIKYNFLDKS